MSGKIFRAIWAAAVAVFLASLVFLLGISYNYFSRLQLKLLKNQTELAAQGVSLSGQNYFDGLDPDDYRITWIGGDGSVWYDNEADTAEMENHLEREEVRKAREEGYGEAVRYSGTLADKELYAAKRLPDGSVLRLSVEQEAAWSLLLGFAQPVCIVIVIALILSFVLASRLAAGLVKPINEIDPENPQQYYGRKEYREVEPLLRHISEQQAQLKKDQKQIENTALIRQEFTANVSHELKTPLHAISGYAELIENGMVQSADIVPFAGKIRLESLRLMRLVEDIIDLTRLDNGGREAVWEECDLCRIAENAIDSLEAEASARHISIGLKGTEAPLRAVPQLLYSTVYNLCDNAIKYNRSGGNVTVSIRRSGTDVILTVKDTGIGIPEEEQERIFERFYRADKSRSKDVGGTGLGLSIVKHAVMIHHGKIEVNSQAGQGSEFIVTIPDKPVEQE